MWRSQAETEGLTLLKADNKSGYFGVRHQPGFSKPKPYQAQVRRGFKMVHLGTFATAEEAALCVARTPEGRAAAERAHRRRQRLRRDLHTSETGNTARSAPPGRRGEVADA